MKKKHCCAIEAQFLRQLLSQQGRNKVRWRPGQEHKRSQGGRNGSCSPKFLENIVILSFERRFSKQNSVIRLKSNIVPPKFVAPPNFWAGCATGQEASLAPPCSNMRSFGSKCTALKKVFVTLLGLYGVPRSDLAPP